MSAPGLFHGRISTGRKIADKTFRFVCFAAALTAALFLVLLLYSVMKDGAARLDLKFFSEFTSRIPDKAGIKASLWGTLWVISLTAVMAIPVGVAAAIYLEEFVQKSSRLAAFIQLNISNLAGVPSIIYGLLGLALFVRFFGLDRSVIAGALTMSLLILPMIIVVSQEAIRAVPQSLREGALAIGATRWQAVRTQVLPAAMSGIITGIILSLSRAIGESAPLITIGAVTFIATTPQSLGDKFTVLPIQIFDWSSRPQPGYHYAAAAAIIVLLSVLLLLNAVAIVIRARSQKRF